MKSNKYHAPIICRIKKFFHIHSPIAYTNCLIGCKSRNKKRCKNCNLCVVKLISDGFNEGLKSNTKSAMQLLEERRQNNGKQ